MPHLIVSGSKIALDLEFERAISIGRHVGNALPLPDPEVSRHHAQIFPRDGEFVVTDLGSRNGVHVNGEKVREYTLVPGDEVVLGGTVLLFSPPENEKYETLLSRPGRALWRAAGLRKRFPAASVTTFSTGELDERIGQWFSREEKSVLLPYNLRSTFLQLVDRTDTCDGPEELGTLVLHFLDDLFGLRRGTFSLKSPDQRALRATARLYNGGDEPDSAADYAVHRDILRVVADAGKAVYCADCGGDYRFRHIPRKNEPYKTQSFLAVPVLAGGKAAGFLYLDQPQGAPRYDFKCLVQAYLAAGILGKCLYWYQRGQSEADAENPQ